MLGVSSIASDQRQLVACGEDRNLTALLSQLYHRSGLHRRYAGQSLRVQQSLTNN